MKYTLLQLTQSILSSMDADPVNSINDTLESQQVSEILKTCFDYISSKANLPEHYDEFNLNSSLVTTPTMLIKPDNIDDMQWFRYNKFTASDNEDYWQEVKYLEPSDFRDLVDNLDTTNSNVSSFSHTVSGESIEFHYRNDHAPTWYTSFDDNTIVCDSYDAAVDAMLQGSKTSCFGRFIIPWTMADAFVPDLSAEQFTLLLNEAKALAWAEMKQSVHQKAEKMARYSWIHTQKSKEDVRGPNSTLDRLPNYGRH